MKKLPWILVLIAAALLFLRPQEGPVPASPPLPSTPETRASQSPFGTWKPEVPEVPTRKADPSALLDAVTQGITASGAGGFTLRDRNVSAHFLKEGVGIAAVGHLHGEAGSPRVRHLLRWSLEGSREVDPRPVHELPGKVNRYSGDRKDWVSGAPTYGSVVYDDIRPGVDLVVESVARGVKTTIHAETAAGMGRLRFSYEGADRVRVVENGTALEISTPLGTLREDRLVAWQDAPDGRREVTARYVEAEGAGYTIELEGTDPELPLTVDPVLSWSSYLGGTRAPIGDDQAYAIGVDATGAVYIGGYTYSINFPTLNPGTAYVDSTLGANQDGFIMKFNSLGTAVEWSTYLGGNATESVTGIAMDPAGNPVVVGWTSSPDFPYTIGQAFTYWDGFIAKFASNGSMTFSTFLGGSNSQDQINAVAVDGSSSIYVTGYTYSSNFPVSNGFDPTFNGYTDAFVTKINSTGSAVVWSSFLGGTSYDYGNGIALDPGGAVYVVGHTQSSDFPTTPGQDSTLNNGQDAFIAKISPAGNSVAWSTLVGGSSGSDLFYGVAVTTDATPEPVAVGSTSTADYPFTAGSYDTTASGTDGVVTRFKADGSGMAYSTFLGGASTDYATAVVAGPAGTVFVTGYTYSAAFPTTAGAYRTTLVSGPEAFITQINAAGTALVASTLVGGNGTDYGRAIAVKPDLSAVYITGQTYSTNFSLNTLGVGGPYVDASLGGQTDAFVACLPAALNVMLWESYAGGTESLSDDNGYGIAVDSTGRVYVTGQTNSLDFPAFRPGLEYLDSTYGLYTDSFVSRITTDGLGQAVLEWSTYLGGNSGDYATGIAISPTDNPVVVGYTGSTDFPLLNAADATISGYESFVTSFNTDGTIRFSTFLGGSSTDYGRSVAVDPVLGRIAVVGYTYSSSSFPIVGINADATAGVTPDFFVALLDPNGPLLWSTYLGGSSSESDGSVAIDGLGNVYAGGYTTSNDLTSVLPTFPVVPDNSMSGTSDAFVASFDAAGARRWIRYLGGNQYEYVNAMAVSPDGAHLYAVGHTGSSDFPTLNAIDAVFNSTDGIVVKLDPADGNILWSTFLGGTSSDYLQGAAVDAAGDVYVTGYSYSSTYPVKGAVDSTWNGYYDAVVTRIYASGTALAWSTFLGGNAYDYARGIALGPGGSVYVTGYTSSPDFPFPNGFDSTYSANNDVFIVRYDNAIPALPNFGAAGAGMFRLDVPATAIPVGGWTNENQFTLKAQLLDSDDDPVRLEVEIKDVNDPLLDLADATSAYLAAGSLASVTVTLPNGSPGQYYFVARTRDIGGRVSAWAPFGGNAQTPLPAVRDIGGDTDLPAVAIASPIPPTVHTTSASTALSGTASDALSGVTAVSWTNSAAVVPAAGTATGTTSWNVASAPLLGNAVNTFTVTARDAAGNIQTATVDVVRDNLAPGIAVTTPSGAVVVGVDSHYIEGTAGDAAPGVLSSVQWSNNRGGSGTASLLGGTWSDTVTGLSPGVNLITVTAYDLAGNTASASAISINYDDTNPVVSISSPANGSITQLATSNLAGTASDNVALGSITCINLTNSLGGTVGGSLAAWTVTGVPLEPGYNQIQVTATDGVGNTQSASVVVYRDTDPPAATIETPTNSPTLTTGANTITLGGSATDDLGVASVSWVRIFDPTGTAVATAGGGTVQSPGSVASGWSTTSIPLNQGAGLYSITVTITDVAGRTNTDSIDVTLDLTAPVLLVDNPAGTLVVVTSNPTFNFDGRASDNSDVTSLTYSLNGATAVDLTTSVPLPDPGEFTWNGSVTLIPGPNTLTLTASDDIIPLPLSTVVTLTIIYDPTAPTVKITGPTTGDDYYSGSASLPLAGTASDNRSVTLVSWNRTQGMSTVSGTATGTTSWSVAAIPLLTGVQTITVTADDEAGNSVTDTLTVTYDPNEPEVSITSPTVASVFKTMTSPMTPGVIDLGGTANDDILLDTLVWSNAANGAFGVIAPSASWSVSSLPLDPGLNPITVIATDAAGNLKTDTISIWYDTTAPTITIQAPTGLATYLTNASTVDLSGIASDDVGIDSVTWINAATGVPGTATGTAAWSQLTVALNPGDNLITFTVTDDVGRTATDAITVHRDPTPPSVTITAPTAAATYSTTSTPVVLGGNVSDLDGTPAAALPASVQWFNLTTGGSGFASVLAGAWSGSAPLTSGDNLIQVVATDLAGNTSSASLTVTYDPAAPLISILTPTTDLTYTTGSSPILLTGSASDDVAVVSVGWANAATSTSGPTTGTPTSWTATVPLTIGTNLITLTATDGVGRTGTTRITVTFDPVAPTANITSPSSDAVIRTTFASVSLAGLASDNLEVQSVAYANATTGESGTAAGTNSWSVPSITLVEGSNQIDITVTDTVGNFSVTTATIIYDGTPPTVLIDTPTNTGAYATSTRPLIIGGTVTDNLQIAAVTWTNDRGGGGAADVSGTATLGTWTTTTVPVYLYPGVNVITVTATDGHEYSDSDVITITFTPESTAPTITIQSPSAAGSAVSATQAITVSGQADDNVLVVSVGWKNRTTGIKGAAALTGGPNPVNWSADIPLVNGINEIVATATDDAGNSATATIFISYDSGSDGVLPGITVTGPTLLSIYSSTSSPLLVTLSATDDVGVAAVRWTNSEMGADGSATPGPGTAWTADIPLILGSNTLTFTASDPSGNAATDTLTVNFLPPPGDGSAPLVSITSHSTASSLGVSVQGLTLSGIASDNVLVTGITWANAADGSGGSADGTTSWLVDLNLVSGINIITIKAYDSSGNVDTDQITVVYTPPPPPPEEQAAGYCGLLGIETFGVLAMIALLRRRRR